MKNLKNKYFPKRFSHILIAIAPPKKSPPKTPATKPTTKSSNKKPARDEFLKTVFLGVFRYFSAIFANFSLKNNIFRIFLTFFLAFLTFFAISCSSSKILIGKTGTKLLPASIYVTNSKKINLLENAEFSENREKIDVVQLISGNFSNKNFEFLANLVIDNEKISLSLFSPLGANLGKISYRENSVDFHSEFFPKSVKAEYIIADVQNAYFPFENLRRNFEKAGLTFLQEIQPVWEKNSQNRKKTTIIRKIYDKNQLIETISVFNDIVVIENNLRNYKYILQTLDENF